MTGSGSPEVEVFHGPEELAESVARRLVEALLRLQASGRVPSVVLTGGSIADEIHRAVLDVPEHHDVDWSRVEIWFGDERFVPAEDDDRNALHARETLLSALPLDPGRVHEMPASDSGFVDVESAAAAYAADVVGVLGEDPRFDVLMLGVGPDGHCASLFPGHAAVSATGVAVGVNNSPKPPPTRISLTMEALRGADEVWFVASGTGKAEAVGKAFAGGDPAVLPAAGPRGRRRTVWLLDAGAAIELDHRAGQDR